MALVFPCDMPVGGVESQIFRVQRNDLVSPANRGRVNGVQNGFPLWVMAVTLANATDAESDAWETFAAKLRGGARYFYGFDLTRPYPKAHASGFAGMVRHGGGAFDGTATSWSLNADRDVVTIDGLPDAFVLSLRDYIGFKWGTTQCALVQCMEAAAPIAGTLSVTVDPPVPGGDAVTVVPDDAVCHFDNPRCLMKQVVGQTKLGGRDILHTLGGTFTAIQDLLP